MAAVFTQGYALVIGVGGNLPNTVDDAIGITTLLTDPARCAYPSNQVVSLTGDQATRDAILLHLDRLAASTNAQSTVILYFSGHGYRETTPDKDHYYLIPADYNPKRFDETTIDGATFTQKIKALPAQKVLVLLDCCHAGGLAEIKSIGKKVNLAPLPIETRALLAQGKGHVVIASSQEEELSFAGRPYSAFTLAIVEAFCGVGVAKHDGHVRVADLALHTREVVPYRTKGKQHPILHFEQADNFVLAYYAAGAPQSKGLPFSTSIEIEPTAGSWRFPLADIERSPKPSLGKLDYLGALEQFHELISKQSPGLQSDFLVYENRLRENLVRERRYGSTETVRAERSEIVDRLNDLAQQAKLGISFNDLAGNTSFQ